MSDSLGLEAVGEVFRLNRIDAAHVRVGDSLILHGPGGGAAVYQPFPARLEAAAADSTFLIVNQRVQAWAAYAFGNLVRWGPTSTGKQETPTPNGLEHITWKGRLQRSTEDPTWILPYAMNFINHRGISLHQYALPGYPASHACARLLMDDAAWLYDWVETWEVSGDGLRVTQQGTPILVMGDFDWESPGPWRRVVQDPEAASVGLTEIEEALGARVPGG
ncbi:MAG: L,D-transpeptidase [Gemmatimonadota bacterium]|nr:L,D-transpeptidase [Gemmatimonadota bacterium]